jgi:hypothetical protein
MTGELFLAYVEQCLVPTLRRNDIVAMDNCRVHMAPAVRQAIEKAKASVRYLPKVRSMKQHICVIEGCEARATAKGLCAKHYMRTRRHGDPSQVKQRGAPKNAQKAELRGMFDPR